MARAIVTVPAAIRKGDIITVRALVQHAMETGYRPGSDGRLVPRDLIRRVRCTLTDAMGEREVFAAEFHAAVAANPLLSFRLRVERPGTLAITWQGDNGFLHRETKALGVA